MPEDNSKGRPPMPPKKPPAAMPSLWQYAGIGIDLAAAVGMFTLGGWLVDRWLGRFPRYTVVGAILGLIGGMYNLIRQAFAATREVTKGDDETPKDGGT